ncbi:Protein CBG23236 [Caenorhabditis briggsae]|uniref:Protein CBG23236 n=1 Tax=Caenorhabditis briggsae TaxID=6238 RepID=A8Y4E2_CAEBR|nr:Protein CBG23236 [Caenorhabditis briggsae]CAP39762.1 Protein CBG23236 [Caenorhabditis briggsae]
MISSYRLLCQLFDLDVNNEWSVTTRKNFYKKFIKTVYMEEMNYFEVEQTKKTRRYIIRSNGPIEFEKYKYYWNDTLLESKRSLNLCEYRISWMIDSKELDETYNADGVKMKSLFYYCHFAQSCMGLECRIDSRLLVPPIFLTVFVTIFWLFKRMLWRDMKRTERIQRENRTAENPATIERIEPGDEFYDRFVNIVFDKYSGFFDIGENDEGLLYTVHPEKPIEFEKQKYYWSKTHEDVKDETHFCGYYFTTVDSPEFHKTRFSNGTKANVLFFTCGFPYSCKGIHCVIEFRFFLILLCCAGMMVVIFLIRKCVIREMEQMEKLRNGPRLPQFMHPPGPRFMPPLTPSSPPSEPPPPSYNVIFSNSPPSYESVVRDKVTYTLPSYSSTVSQ